MASARASADLEPVGELKFGQVGIANLRLKRLDRDTLAAELAHKVASAPQLFARAPVVLDLSPGEHETLLQHEAALHRLGFEIADFGATQASISIRVAQLSAFAGRGTARSAVL